MEFGIFCALAIVFGLIYLTTKVVIKDKEEEERTKAEERTKEQFYLRFKNYRDRFNREELKELHILLNHFGSQKQYLLKYLDFLLQEKIISGDDLTCQGSLFRYWVESELIDSSTSLERTWELGCHDPFTSHYIMACMHVNRLEKKEGAE